MAAGLPKRGWMSKLVRTAALLVAVVTAGGGLATLATTATASAAPASQAAATVNLDATARGLVYRGLKAAGRGERCDENFQIVGVADGACTHGPDPAPPGIDIRRRDRFAADTGSSTTAAGTSSVPCYGDGSSGNRVQAIYAHAAGADRLSQLSGSMSAWAAGADQVFNGSAAETGGVRHLRFVTNSICNLVISDVTLSSAAMNDFGTAISELRNQGFNRTDRKYLVWADTNVYCGIAQVYGDDSAAQTNASNGSTTVPGEFARVDNGCWGLSGQSIEAHEIMHTLGGVQTSAPHATAHNHCWDESDRMCYVDAPGVTMVQTCPTSHENLFDCNHDDYYYAGTPPSNNYLSSHWNTANSTFLTNANPTPANPAPPAPTPPPPTPAPTQTPSTFHAYGGFPGGTRVARGDVNGDGTTDIVTGAGPGGGPNVRVFRPDGSLLSSWFAYGTGFSGGVDVAACDLDGDGKAEIITGPGAGGGPDVRVFRADGTLIKSFFAYSGGFAGGVNVSCADVNGDGKPEILTGPGAGGGPDVREFKSDGTLIKSFFAYSGGFAGGVDVAGGNVDNSGAAEIITGPGAGGGPNARIFRGDGTLLRSWFAYDGGFAGGVRVSCADLNNDGSCEIVTGPGPGGGPNVRTFNSSGALLSSFFQLSPSMAGGIDVGAGTDGIVSTTWSTTDVVHIPSKS
jgi:hypothetical protein